MEVSDKGVREAARRDDHGAPVVRGVAGGNRGRSGAAMLISSEWVGVSSVLGPLLFIIYIHDVGVGLDYVISKFADDTKIGNSVL